MDGYGSGGAAPLVNGFELGAEYLCADNVLKAHAIVYHLYHDRYFNQHGGKVGITLSSGFFYPNHPAGYWEDDELVDRAMQFQVRSFWLAMIILSSKLCVDLAGLVCSQYFQSVRILSTDRSADGGQQQRARRPTVVEAAPMVE